MYVRSTNGSLLDKVVLMSVVFQFSPSVVEGEEDDAAERGGGDVRPWHLRLGLRERRAPYKIHVN